MRRPLSLTLLFVFACSLPARIEAQSPFGWIESDQWACLVPLQGNDCSGSGVHVMTRNWVEPHDLRLESPVVGEVWADIDFGGASPSAAWLGSGDPEWVNIGLGPDPSVVDWDGYLSGRGLENNFVAGIAVTYVRNTTGTDLSIDVCSSSDDSSLVLVNNALVTAVTVCRGTAGDCSEVNPAVLAPGVNKITVIVWEGFGGFGFRLALARPGGVKYTQADAEIEYLGASSAAGVIGPVPLAFREYPGSEYSCPSSSHRVTIRGSGFAPDQSYAVVEELPGCVAGGLIVSNVSPGGAVEGISQPPAASVTQIEELELEGFYGVDRGGASEGLRDDGGTPGDPSDDVYTSTSTSGGDVWADGDDFELQYTFVEGDFDVAVEFLERSGGNGRWGKFGLMARQYDDVDADGLAIFHPRGDVASVCDRNTSVKDHLADLQDCANLEGRLVDDVCGGGIFGTDPFPDATLCHPRFLRLTRRGTQIQGWAANDPGLGSGALNPHDDCNWVSSSRTGGVDWGPDIPESLAVGFFNSEHNSNGFAVQSIRYRVLASTPALPLRPIGQRIVWNVSGTVLNGPGVSYEVSGPRTTSALARGRAGSANVQGPRRLSFQAAPSGPIGDFANAHDIGQLGPCTPGSVTLDGPGTYTMTASGIDIWATGDQFHFAYTEVSGDFEALVRFADIVHPPANGRWGKFGLMARWDCTPNSAYFFTHNAGATNDLCDVDAPRTAFRPYSEIDGGNNEPSAVWWQDLYDEEPMDAGCTIPYPAPRTDLRGDDRNIAPWLRLVRRGSTFYGYGSDDGSAWKPLASFSWPEAPATLLVGVAMTSHANCDVQSITFDSFRVGSAPALEAGIDPLLGPDDLAALGEEVFREEFDAAEEGGLPDGWFANGWGGQVPFGFFPQVTFPERAEGGRLRLGDIRNSPLGPGEDRGTIAFPTRPIPADGAYLYDFDVFFSYNQAAAADGNPPADGLTLAVVGVPDEVERDFEATPAETVGSFRRRTIGVPCADQSTTILTGDDSYTTRSVTGRDIWVDGDTFEFAYRSVAGDFDISIEMTDRRFPPAGRWGKLGLMARQSLEHHSKVGAIIDHGPDLQDPARYFRRLRHRNLWSVQEPAAAAGFGAVDPVDGSALSHPRYLRLSRRGDVIAGWVANHAGDAGMDPTDDELWYLVYEDATWADVDVVFLGFGYSVHNTSGCAPGEIDWSLVHFAGAEVPDPAQEPVPYGLDLRLGDRGGGIGWHRLSISQFERAVTSRELTSNSYAIEFDNWHGGQVENDGDAGNVSGWNPLGGAEGTGTGRYHIGVNVNDSVFTAQRNHQVGTHDRDLPDVYHPDGLNTRVLYDHGLVRAWVRPNTGALRGGWVLVADYEIEPLSVNAVNALVGFTAATGGATTTMEVDNLVIRDLGQRLPEFVRGDADANGRIELTDAIRVLGFLFVGAAAPTCFDAADSDDNSRLELTDAVRILNWLFTGGQAPRPPGPSLAQYPASDCGTDPTDDGLDCARIAATCD